MNDDNIPNIKKWIVFYPVYINSKKTIAEGRRINATKACENPTCVEIGDCCGYLKLPFAIEIDKAYPRDFMQRGRVRVLLKKEDGSLHNPAISSKPGFLTETSLNEKWDSWAGLNGLCQMHSCYLARLYFMFNIVEYAIWSMVALQPLWQKSLWKQLMMHVAELVPRHPGRTKKQEPTSTSNAGPSKSAKGGRKRR